MKSLELQIRIEIIAEQIERELEPTSINKYTKESSVLFTRFSHQMKAAYNTTASPQEV
jgi:hypothetical protein